jgi:hypothetical protein
VTEAPAEGTAAEDEEKKVNPDDELVEGEVEAREAQRRRRIDQRAINRKKFQSGWSDMV